MERFELTVYTKPIPWKPPRVTRNGTYVDPKVTALQHHIGWLARQQMGNKPLMDGALKFRVKFYHPRPNRRPGDYPFCLQWGNDIHDAPKLTRPDRVNMAKLVEDALEGIVYKDDSIIYDGRDQKFYADHGTEPRIEIAIWEG
jgi:Holliday junction resolvase RusA-like endonuclease